MQSSTMFDAKCIIHNTQFIIYSTQFMIFNTKLTFKRELEATNASISEVSEEE